MLQLGQIGEWVRKRYRGGLYLLSVLVAKQKLDGGNRAGCMLILSMILTSEEDFIVQESPGFGGGITSDI